MKSKMNGTSLVIRTRNIRLGRGRIGLRWPGSGRQLEETRLFMIRISSWV